MEGAGCLLDVFGRSRGKIHARTHPPPPKAPPGAGALPAAPSCAPAGAARRPPPAELRHGAAGRAARHGHGHGPGLAERVPGRAEPPLPRARLDGLKTHPGQAAR